MPRPSIAAAMLPHQTVLPAALGARRACLSASQAQVQNARSRPAAAVCLQTASDVQLEPAASVSVLMLGRP